MRFYHELTQNPCAGDRRALVKMARGYELRDARSAHMVGVQWTDDESSVCVIDYHHNFMQKAMELYEKAALPATDWDSSLFGPPHPEAAYRLALWHEGRLDQRTIHKMRPTHNFAKALEYYKIAANNFNQEESLWSYR